MAAWSPNAALSRKGGFDKSRRGCSMVLHMAIDPPEEAIGKPARTLLHRKNRFAQLSHMGAGRGTYLSLNSRARYVEDHHVNPSFQFVRQVLLNGRPQFGS